MERHGHLTLDPNVRQLLLAASPATIDRLLAPIRGTAGHRRKRKPTTKSSREIPVRTFADWKEPAPGFLEMDFVAHGGDSMQGTFLWSLVATDVCSGWTEAVPLVAREQSLVVEGLEVIRRQLPVPVLGIDSDNDSAFINETLQGYCQEQQIEFTRSRPYQKNDQAWIEQKNGSVIRRFVGYRRFSGLIAGQCLARLYRMVRLYVNYFQPSFKLLSKTRDGAKIKKRYHKPATPCERLLAHASVSDAAKEALRAEIAPLDPAELLHQIREGQAALAALGSGDLSHGPERQSLEEFLAKLPELWREGEVRPTHRNASVLTAHLANPEGPVRGGLAGDPRVAPRRSRLDGQVVDGTVAARLPRPVSGRATADLAASHPGVASCDGEVARPWLPWHEGYRSERNYCWLINNYKRRYVFVKFASSTI